MGGRGSASSGGSYESRLNKIGVKSTDLKGLTSSEKELLVSTLEDASKGGSTPLSRVETTTGWIQSAQAGHAAAMYDPDTQTLTISARIFHENRYVETLDTSAQVARLKKAISGAEESEKAYLARVTGVKADKKKDAVWKKEASAASARAVRLKQELKEVEHEGNKPHSVASSFRNVKDQVRATIFHEYGHHVDFSTISRATAGVKGFSRYTDTPREVFAEWFAAKKMRLVKSTPSPIEDQISQFYK